MEALYPDPPLVVFLSNNETRKLRWHELDHAQRFLAAHGKDASDIEKREAVVKGWTERFHALFDAMRKGLANDAWRQHAIFVGYDAFGPAFYGRWGGWKKYGIPTPDRIDPNPLYWDGGSPSLYDNDWEPDKTDYNVWSPQTEAMNFPFMVDEAIELNPDYWFEISIWDGDKDWWTPTKGVNKRSKPNQYRAKGQTWSPQRYAGWTQYCMWIVRPRVVREFRGSAQPRLPVKDRGGTQVFEGYQPYWNALLANVERVWNHPLLTRFWRKGKLVPNRAGQNPWNSNLLDKYKGVDRWFRLDTSLDPPRPWHNTTNLHVFSLAYVLGEGDNREWLVYAHSPLGEQKNVQITIPGRGKITVDIPVGGAFYHIDRSGNLEVVK